MIIRIGSRQSALAQIQAYQVGSVLTQKFKHIQVEYNFRESLGDKNLHDPLWKLPEKGVFTEDFHQDLTSGSVDMIVHSWKDLPTAVREETLIAATLPRADARDLLLFKKKTSQDLKDIVILSSSPRREYNLTEFFMEHWPWPLERVQFKPVRGNIQTRVRKLLEDSEAQGLIIAKAALDRLLLSEERFASEKAQVLSYLDPLNFSILPLSLNPGAAAQGAIAIEVLRSRKDLLSLLTQINHEKTFSEAQHERDILAQTGGGCHQKLGISAQKFEFGTVLSVRGDLDTTGKKRLYTIERALKPIKKFKKDESLVVNSQLVAAVRVPKKISIPEFANALLIAKPQAWTEDVEKFYQKFKPVIWAAGTSTWKALTQKGVWVSGCNDGLGKNTPTGLQHLTSTELKWFKITHDKALRASNDLGSYSIVFDYDWKELKSKKAIFWSAAIFFEEALNVCPEWILSSDVLHFCGPGSTFERLSQSVKVHVCLNEEDWRTSWIEE